MNEKLEVDINIKVRGGDVFMKADGLTEEGIYRLLEMLVNRYREGNYVDATDKLGEN